MPNLSIKDVPEAWAETLRQRALRNHRSLQGELMFIIERAVQEGTHPPAAAASDQLMVRGDTRVGSSDRRGDPIIRSGWKTIEQIAAELREKRPEPAAGSPPGDEDIVRPPRGDPSAS